MQWDQGNNIITYLCSTQEHSEHTTAILSKGNNTSSVSQSSHIKPLALHFWKKINNTNANA